VTYYVLVVIEFSSRKIHVAGITPRPEPDRAFMMQVGRNLTDPFDGFVLGKRFLILDRDKKLGNALIEPEERVGDLQGPVRVRQRMGGTLNDYYREAA